MQLRTWLKASGRVKEEGEEEEVEDNAEEEDENGEGAERACRRRKDSKTFTSSSLCSRVGARGMCVSVGVGVYDV